MTTPLSALVLIASQTADEIFDVMIAVGRLVGLPVDTWRAGDPTRTTFRGVAETTATRDEVMVEFAKASFITGPADQRASGEWLKLRASDVYGVEADDATFSAPTITVDNASGGLYEIDVNGLTVSSSVTGALFTNQALVTINPLETGVSILLVAQTAGADGTVALDDIDTIVSPALEGVTIVSSTAAEGADEQSEQGIVDECLATLGALSPNGPFDAYEFVARNEDLTGIAGVTRAKSDGDTTDGTVTVYVGTASAGLDAGSIADIQDAVDEWAEPICTEATVVTMTPQTIASTFNLTPNASELQSAIEQALDAYYLTWDFDDNGGLVARDALASVVRAVGVANGVIFHTISVTLPATDTALTIDRFPLRGTVVLT